MPWHEEVAKGSEDENIKYCKKDGKFTEEGESLQSKKEEKKLKKESKC